MRDRRSRFGPGLSRSRCSNPCSASALQPSSWLRLLSLRSGHAVRLHFEHTASYEDELFAVGHLNAHGAREDARNQGGLRVDTQFTRFT